ncbi:hypothetical protein [Reichenbachiella ulvae]|uniref:Uncharacterized protein n=1 Tax=Reichenbachiella ulvae TaxID=2980104 RepID=A0ABT3CXV5_9BACT|nr:hypothetical protein [Reichenbachiella ulvae]MCV9388411.1 hypothetical protein [Reichenbachiella ulvae]
MKQKFHFFLFMTLGLLLSSYGQVEAQMVGADAMQFKELVYHDNLPKYLLSTKTAVLVSTPRSEEDPRLRSNWKELSEFAHKYFRQMKIDAIAYYYLDDVFANVRQNEIFYTEMAEREIKYLILLDQKRVELDSGTTNYYRITVTSFNDESSFVSQGQNAWKIEGYNLMDLLIEMNKDVVRAEMEMSNYLIPEFPEFFNSTNIIGGRRIPTYAMDLKVETLVVPRFKKLMVEDSSSVDQAYLSEVAKYNREVDRKNRKLEQIMETYSPLKYKLTDEVTAKAIYNDGHQFALMRIDGTGKMIRESLGYETNTGETDYVTLKAGLGGSYTYPLPVDAVVSKYYVQHVFTKDVYVGLKWDADLTWEEALQNFIFHMKDILRVK